MRLIVVVPAFAGRLAFRQPDPLFCVLDMPVAKNDVGPPAVASSRRMEEPPSPWQTDDVVNKQLRDRGRVFLVDGIVADGNHVTGRPDARLCDKALAQIKTQAQSPKQIVVLHFPIMVV